MCGIFGHISSTKLKSDCEIEKIKKSLRLLSHRGPDGQSYLVDDYCSFGFDHLAFFDTKNSVQPLTNIQKTIFLVCNGEIYNYKDLKQDTHTYNYQTNSDCEVIIALYEKYGLNFISHIKGQFAFALWDKINNKLFLARDKFGICPLYFLKKNKELYFSSEIKALLSFTDSRSFDPDELVSSMLFYGPDPNKTCFKGIYQVPPAHILEYSLTSGELKNRRYWCPVFCVDASLEQESDTLLFERFNSLLVQAVQRRIHGDYLPGVYTSGGIDSSCIAYILSTITNQTTLFSIQFADKKYDESVFQNHLYKSLGISYKTLHITEDDLLFHFFETLRHTETPLFRSAPVPMYLLSSLVHDSGYKTVLSGEGADEMLAGYPVFMKYIPSIVEKYAKFKQVISLFSNAETILKEMDTRYKRYIYDLSDSSESIHTAQNIEIDTKLSRYLLSGQGDRVSMAHGIEQRFPFLDDDLVDFILGLPMRYFIQDQQGKYILRQVMADKIPKSIVTRKKQGYLSPDKIFIDAIRTNETIKNLCSEQNIKNTGIFEHLSVKKVIDFLGKNKNDEITNSIFMFVLSVLSLNEMYIKSNEISM